MFRILARLARSRTSNQATAAWPYELESARDVFSRIYHRRGWGDGESASGPGSSVARVGFFKAELESLLKEIQAKTLLDAGCGDFNWMKELNINLTRYIGIDVVPDLIAKNQQAYGSDIRTFVCLDMTRDKLPQANVVFCRDCLVHFSWEDIFAALENFKQSGSIYLLTTTFTRVQYNI